MKNLLLILALFIVSCSSGEASKLSDANLVALSYVKNSKNLDFNLAYELLSEEDKNVLSKEDYTKFKEPEVMMEIAKAVALQSEYKIKETSIEEKSANVIVEISSPDYSFLFQSIVASAFRSAFDTSKETDNQLEDFSKDVSKLIEDGDVPKQIIDQSIQLVLENNEWKVSEGLKVAYQKSINTKKVDELLSIASSLDKKKKYSEAINTYKEILSIDDSNTDAISSMKKVEGKLAEQKIKQDYINKIEIFDFIATRINTYSSKNVPAVRFAIRNNGNRSLDEVEVTVYFYDGNDNAIFEEKYYPILVSSYSLNNTGSLKPNYIKRQKENNYYTIDELGPEWLGKADAIVSDLRFSEEE
jgi:tetratricopeptide (TPR) repeat protein